MERLKTKVIITNQDLLGCDRWGCGYNMTYTLSLRSHRVCQIENVKGHNGIFQLAESTLVNKKRC
jgi:hypothetical protein